MIQFILGAMVGGALGVVIMCLLQINNERSDEQ